MNAIYFNEPPANSPRKYQLICSKTSIKDIPEREKYKQIVYKEVWNEQKH